MTTSIRLITKGNTRYILYKNKRYRIVSDKDDSSIVHQLQAIRKLLEKKRQKRKRAARKAKSKEVPLPILKGNSVTAEMVQQQIDLVKKSQALEADFKLRNELRIQQDVFNKETAEKEKKLKEEKADHVNVTIEGVETPVPKRVAHTGVKMQAGTFLQKKTVKQLQEIMKENGIFKGHSSKDKNGLISVVLQQPIETLEAIQGLPAAPETPTKKRKTTEEAPTVDFSGNGLGGGKLVGLWNDEIEHMMKKFKSFKGVFPIDLLNMMPINKSDKHFSFIMNTSPTTNKNPIGHWVAVNVFKNSVEYFDPVGEEPPKHFMKYMKPVLREFGEGPYQYKINRVQFQNRKTDTCGYHSMRFLKDREDGKSFMQATKFDKIDKSIQGEKDIEKFKKQIKQFGYIRP